MAMRPTAPPLTGPVLLDIVLVGGGHAHVEVLRRFAMRPLAGARLTLVSPGPTTPYSGMLPGLIAGHYAPEEVEIDLVPLCRAAGARRIDARAIGLDPDLKRLRLEDRPDIAYDLLSLDIGSVPSTDGVEGARANALPVKPVPAFLQRLEHVLDLDGGSRSPLSIVTVGAGAAGIEVTLALHHRLFKERSADHRSAGRAISFHVVDTAPSLLPTHAPAVGRRLAAELAAIGAVPHLGVPVARVEPGAVVLETGARIAGDAIVWATGGAPAPWLRDTGLALDGRGFVAIDETLRSTSHPTVFAAGDCATMVGHRRPKSGVFAVRQGPPLARALRQAARGLPLDRFVPQRRFLSLISTGDTRAVASRGSLVAAGRTMWRLKDWIDRRFMRRYTDLPAMNTGRDGSREAVPGMASALAHLAMRCAGCGAKLPSGPLSRALARLSDTRQQPHGGIDLGSPDDAAELTPPPGMTLLQSIDWFPTPVDDPYLAGRIAALHCLGDIHAMGGEPWKALALATLPPMPSDKTEEDLFQLLAGAAAELAAAGAVLVGGHSAEADKLGLGLVINGLAAPGAILRKSGARAGDVLVLTKPIGTGAVLAGEMRGRARGRWVAATVASMTRGVGPAAATLRAHGATAMTDVTGFGLGGHLIEIMEASRLDARLGAAAIPVLPGARELLAAGVTSTIEPANAERIAAAASYDEDGGKEGAESGDGGEGGIDPVTQALLADPRTAGGLLASIPADRAEACVAALRQGGDMDAAVIGRLEAMTGARPRLRVDQTAV